MRPSTGCWIIGRVFGKVPLFPQASKHFVRADVVEQTNPVSPFPYGLKEVIRTDYIGVDKITRASNRAVHVRLGREVTDSIYTIIIEYGIEAAALGYITLNEYVSFGEALLYFG